MQRQSFSAWRLPREQDGVVLLEDIRVTRGRFTSQERHFHEELELHFIERGRALFLLREGRLLAGPGTLLWIPPRRDHVVLEASDDCRRWMLLCRPRLVRQVLPESARDGLLGRAAREQSGLLRSRAALSLRQTYAEIHADRGEELPLFNAAMAFGLARSWLHFRSATESPEPSALHPAVAKAIGLLRGGTRPSLTELARRCELSESHLSKVFFAQVGTTVTEFRNRLGIERFLEIYGDGGQTTVLEAALDAGFGSYPQFHRVFRKHLGYSPGEHRKRVPAERAVGSGPGPD